MKGDRFVILGGQQDAADATTFSLKAVQWSSIVKSSRFPSASNQLRSSIWNFPRVLGRLVHACSVVVTSLGVSGLSGAV